MQLYHRKHYFYLRCTHLEINTMALKYFDIPVLSSGGSDNATIVEITDDDIAHCGSSFCPGFVPTSEASDEADDKTVDNFQTDLTKIYILAGIFLGCSLSAAAIIAVFVDPLTRFGEDERNSEKEELTGVQLLVATFRHMRHRNQILVIPITIWSGIEQGFFNAAFTAVSAEN